MSVLEHPVEFPDGKYITGYTGPEMLCLVNVSCQISYQVNLIHADSKLMRAEEVSSEVTRLFSCGADSWYKVSETNHLNSMKNIKLIFITK